MTKEYKEALKLGLTFVGVAFFVVSSIVLVFVLIIPGCFNAQRVEQAEEALDQTTDVARAIWFGPQCKATSRLALCQQAERCLETSARSGLACKAWNDLVAQGCTGDLSDHIACISAQNTSQSICQEDLGLADVSCTPFKGKHVQDLASPRSPGNRRPDSGARMDGGTRHPG